MAVKKVKLTRWFPSDVKPTRDGPYLTRAGSVRPEMYRAFIDGKWRIGCGTPGLAARMHTISATQDWEWRGLAEQPK